MMAIILPVVLTQNRNKPYFNQADLQKYVADEDEFIEKISGSNIWK